MPVITSLTDEGDWALSEGNGLALTDTTAYIIQQINLLLRTEVGDVKSNPAFGFNMAHYLSLPNTKETADALTEELDFLISDIEGIENYSYNVDAYPMDKETLRLEIEVSELSQNEINIIRHDVSFSPKSKDRFGYVDDKHSPYDRYSAKIEIEKIHITGVTDRIELAHEPMNANIYVFDIDTFAMGSGQILNDITLSGHIDTSGNSATEFTITKEDGITKCYYTDASDDLVEAGLTQTSGDLYNYISTTIATDVVLDNGTDVVYSPDASTNYNLILTEIPISNFDYTLIFHDVLAEATDLQSETLTLNKHSIAYLSRSSKRWYAILSAQLDPGDYIIQYTTYKYVGEE